MTLDPLAPNPKDENSKRSIDWDCSRLSLWRSFCQRYRISEESVPPFECDEGRFVLTKEIGISRRRKILKRSPAMDALMRKEVAKVVEDHKAATALHDGIIYMMHFKGDDGEVVPCYIGKSETLGKTSGVLSANLERLATDTSKFGRWGDNYAYHIGDLSSVVLPGHGVEVQTAKYRSWATALFEGVNTDRPRLRRPVFSGFEPGRERTLGSGPSLGQRA